MEREPTGTVRSVPGTADTWAPGGRGYEQPGSDAAIEAFFAGDPTTTPASTLAAGELTTTRGAARYEARKVLRLVRHIEPWSVLKISLIFFFQFAASLRPGSAPIIERFARLARPDLPPENAAYCRRLTKTWLIVFVGNSALVLGAAWRLLPAPAG